MKPRILFVTASCLAVLGLFVASCAPVAAPTPPAAPPKGPAEASTPAAARPVGPTPTPKTASDQPRYGGVLSIVMQDDPPSFDIHQEIAAVTLWALGGAYSGLLQYDPQQNDKVIPDLADRWERSPDGTVYTFYLRKGVKWHDGKPFTAEDAKYSIDRVRKPPRGTISPRETVFKSVTNVEAVDETSLRVTLSYPAASFITNIATGWMVVLPKHVIEAKANMKKDVVGTGPFKLKDYSPGSSYSVAKNPDYFVQGRPYLDGIRAYVVRDRTVRLAAFRTGQIMITNPGATGISPSQATMLEKEMPDKVVVQRAPSLNFHTFIMNSKVQPWDDPRVRKAASLATDRRAAIEVLAEGEADLGGLMPPSGQWALPQDELLKMPGYRPDKAAEVAEAKRLMSDAGFTVGPKSTILVRAGSEPENLAVFVKSQLDKIGMELALNVREVAAYNKAMAERDFATAVWPEASSLDDPDQIFGERYISKAARNYQGIINPKVDGLFELQSRTLDVAERKRLVIEMQRLAMEDNGKLILFCKRENQGVWRKVKNYKVGVGIYNHNKYQDVWLAE